MVHPHTNTFRRLEEEFHQTSIAPTTVSVEPIPDAEPTVTPGPGETAAPKQHSSLLGYVELLTRRYAVETDTVITILLATLAGAVGPARQVVNPLGGNLPASLNVMLLGAGHPPGLNAMRCATEPLTAIAERHSESKRQKSPQRLREQKVELEQNALRLTAELKKANRKA